jgi:hypothetical protein
VALPSVLVSKTQVPAAGLLLQDSDLDYAFAGLLYISCMVSSFLADHLISETPENKSVDNETLREAWHTTFSVLFRSAGVVLVNKACAGTPRTRLTCSLWMMLLLLFPN